MYTLMHDRWYYEKSVQGRGTHYTLPTMTVTLWSAHILSPGPGYLKLRVVGMMRNGIGHHTNIRRRYCYGVRYKSMMCTMANRIITKNENVRYIRATVLTAIALEHALHDEGQTVEGWPIVMPE